MAAARFPAKTPAQGWRSYDGTRGFPPLFPYPRGRGSCESSPSRGFWVELEGGVPSRSPSTLPRSGDGGVSFGSEPGKSFPQKEAPPSHEP